MTWYAWILVGLFAVRPFCIVALIGKPRRPQNPWTATDAFYGFIAAALLIWAVVSLAGH